MRGLFSPTSDRSPHLRTAEALLILPTARAFAVYSVAVGFCGYGRVVGRRRGGPYWIAPLGL